MTIFFQKVQKTLFWGHVGPFLPKSGKKWIFLENKSLLILDIPIIYHRAKNQKKLMTHSWVKFQTDGRTDRQTDGSTDRQIDIQRVIL